MRWPKIGVGLALAASAFGAACVVAVTIGCGGGGGTLQNTVLFTKTPDMTAAGGQIADPARGIKLIVPPGTLQSSASVTLEVLEKQRDGAAPPGFTAGPNAVNVAVDPAAMAPGSTVQVEIPCGLPYDEFGSMMFAVDGAGACVPLDVTYDGRRKALVGAASKERLATIAVTKGRAAPPVFGFFWAVVGQATSAASGEFYVWQNGGWVSAGGQTMAGKRVAVLVHGMNVRYHEDMSDLARFLTTVPAAQGDRSAAYDAAWAYRYNWGARIDESGDVFAGKLSAAMSGASAVDVFGHSMGGLVSRWALEKRSLGGSVRRLVALGTPHSGVPSRARPALQLLLFTLCPALGVSAGSLAPGVLDLVQTDAPNSFLRRLNDGDSPYRSAARYFTLAGDGWEDYRVGGVSLGKLMEIIYNPGSHTMDHDGIVPVESALYDGLARKSQAWADDQPGHTATVRLTHDELNGDPDAAKQKVVEDELTKWIVGASGGTALYTVVDLHPSGFEWSQAVAIEGDTQVGTGGSADGQPHALLWYGSAASVVDLHPAGAGYSEGVGIAGAYQVGHALGGEPEERALLWRGSPASPIDLTPAGFITSWALGAGGAQQVGEGYTDRAVKHALLWSGSAASAVDLHPASWVESYAYGTDGVRQVGYGRPDSSGSGGMHALLWSGSAGTVVDLHPAAYRETGAVAIAGAQQVGSSDITQGWVSHALLWYGSAASVVDLHPAGYDRSHACGTNGTQQVGNGVKGGVEHALIWSGTAASAVDLNTCLPARYTASRAYAIDADGRIVGCGAGPGFGGHAIMWVPTSRSRSPQRLASGPASARQPLKSQGPSVRWGGRR